MLCETMYNDIPMKEYVQLSKLSISFAVEKELLKWYEFKKQLHRQGLWRNG